jgi:hypothetical protein
MSEDLLDALIEDFEVGKNLINGKEIQIVRLDSNTE